ncbi:MAG: hypothetical protein ACTHOD_06735 [Motilibacteraceae bacterium]
MRGRRCLTAVGLVGLVGLVATLAAWQWALAPHRIWSADASVVFLAPVPRTENPYTWFPKNAQYVAQTAALEVSSDAGRQRLERDGVTFDARLINVGSQWVPIYDRPTVAVHVAGPDPHEVGAVRAAVVDTLVNDADRQQAALGSRPSDRIRATSFGLDTPATATGGRRTRAVGMLLLLSVALWAGFLQLARRSLRPDRGGDGDDVEPGQAQELVVVGGPREDLRR